MVLDVGILDGISEPWRAKRTESEVLGHAGPPKVGIYYEHARVRGLGNGAGKVQRRERFPVAWRRTRHRENLQAEFVSHPFDGVPERAILVGRERVRGDKADELLSNTKPIGFFAVTHRP